jgi:hypothetical protein
MKKLKDLYRDEGLASPQDAAIECHISVFNIYRWLKEEKIQGVLKHGHTYVNLKSLKDYLGVKE